MKVFLKKITGVSLLEMLLVLVVASAILLLLINFSTQKADEFKREHLAAQLQQVLNASLAYYVNNGKWPTSVADLKTNRYLPQLMLNAWGKGFTFKNNPTTGTLYVISEVGSPMDAYLTTGMLPVGFFTTYAKSHVDSTDPTLVPEAKYDVCVRPSGEGSKDCIMVVAIASIPGQSLSNAKAINFASLYRSGACVPVPKCPGEMKAELYVSPAAVSGIFTAPTCRDPNDLSTCTATLDSVGSYTAYATAPAAVSPTGGPVSCDGITASAPCYASPPSSLSDPSTAIKSGQYWRVCLNVITERGVVTPDKNTTPAPAWGQLMGTILAMTRCVPSTDKKTGLEPTGSTFNVWSP